MIGVPEMMLAAAENGGRIRPEVTIVKAVAYAITIGVGREGPIVHIGSALASTLGQLVHMSETRLRIIVASGAAGGIASTFNAPLTGLFFGFEIVLREFSLGALVATSVAAVTGDVISRRDLRIRTRRRRPHLAVLVARSLRPASPCRSAPLAACSPRRCSSERWQAWHSARSSTASSAPRPVHPCSTPSSRKDPVRLIVDLVPVPMTGPGSLTARSRPRLRNSSARRP
jgi:hypothetical protein